MRIVIIDGQGGGVGKALVENITKTCPDLDVIAVGTNAAATANMLKGASIDGATGENAVVYNCQHADIIVGPIGIVMANAMYGEITPKMAEAITSSNAEIIVLPMNRCRVNVVGISNKKLSEYIDEAIKKIKELSRG